MRVLTESETRVQPAPSPAQPAFKTILSVELETAILRSQENLFRLQKPEGYWVGELMVDSTLVSDTVAYHHWNGKVDKRMAAQGRQPPLLDATAGRRLEHLLRRPVGGERHHQGLSRPQARRRPRHRPADVEGARSGAALRRRPAHEHVFQIVSRAHRPVSVGICPDDSVRGAPHRQMVSRELLGHEQLVARPCSCRWPSSTISNPRAPGVAGTLDELYPEGIHERDLAPRARPGKNFAAQFFPVARPPAQIRRMVRRA
jgi:hypothetical protein